MNGPGADQLQIVNAAMRSRRTVNFFTDEPVDSGLIRDAVRAARWAPNHHLTEPWQFFHLGPQSRAAVIELAVTAAVRSKGPQAGEARRERMANVPDWLVLTARRSDDPLREREDYAACCCAAQNLMLYLSAAGLGCKWTTGPVTRDPDLVALLGLSPDEHMVVGVFWVGHPRLIPESRRSSVDTVYQQLP